MADRHGQHGFTLAEMLAALAILMVAITTLLASLADSVSLRRSTDMRLYAAAAVEDVVMQVQLRGVRRQASANHDLDLELAMDGPYLVEQAPGLRFFVKAIEAKDRSDVWLLKLRAQWMEAGEYLEEEFLRVLPRQLPLGARVERFFEDNSDTGQTNGGQTNGR